MFSTIFANLATAIDSLQDGMKRLSAGVAFLAARILDVVANSIAAIFLIVIPPGLLYFTWASFVYNLPGLFNLVVVMGLFYALITTGNWGKVMCIDKHERPPSSGNQHTQP